MAAGGLEARIGGLCRRGGRRLPPCVGLVGTRLELGYFLCRRHVCRGSRPGGRPADTKLGRVSRRAGCRRGAVLCQAACAPRADVRLARGQLVGRDRGGALFSPVLPGAPAGHDDRGSARMAPASAEVGDRAVHRNTSRSGSALRRPPCRHLARRSGSPARPGLVRRLPPGSRKAPGVGKSGRYPLRVGIPAGAERIGGDAGRDAVSGLATPHRSDGRPTP